MGLDDSPICIFMVGIPYSGKTSFVATHEWLAKLPQVSLDREVMLLANGEYSCWEKCVSEASRRCDEHQEHLIQTRQSFVIDKTNLVHTAREKLIHRLRQNGYQTVAIVLDPPDAQTLRERIQKRQGQVVPKDVQKKMRDLFEADQHWLLSEFDAVLHVSQSGEITTLTNKEAI